MIKENKRLHEQRKPFYFYKKESNGPEKYVYAGINHDSANENVVISNEEITDMDYVAKCPKDPRNLYVVTCTDECVEIYSGESIEEELVKAVEKAKEGEQEIDNIPGGYMYFEDEEEAQSFIDNPWGTYKEIIKNSSTNGDSDAGAAFIVLDYGRDLRVISNGDLKLSFRKSYLIKGVKTIGAWVVKKRSTDSRMDSRIYDIKRDERGFITFDDFFYKRYKRELDSMGAKIVDGKAWEKEHGFPTRDDYSSWKEYWDNTTTGFSNGTMILLNPEKRIDEKNAYTER